LNSDRTFSNKLAYYALLIVEKPIGLIPTSWIWRLGAALGSLGFKLAKERRAIVIENLKIVHPELSEAEIQSLAKTVFRTSFANLFSSVNTGFISTKRVTKLVTIEGQENLRNLDPKKGCILLIFHMGNWEVLSRINSLFDTDKPTGAMFRPLNNPYINDHVIKNREKDGTLLFSRKRGLILASKFLRAGGMLGILTDQHAGHPGVKLPLFGKMTSITPLTATLAQKYQCPVIPIALTTTAPGRWNAHYQDPIFIPKDLDKTAATALLIPTMERIMREHTTDIFWLHDYWKIKEEIRNRNKE